MHPWPDRMIHGVSREMQRKVFVLRVSHWNFEQASAPCGGTDAEGHGPNRKLGSGKAAPSASLEVARTRLLPSSGLEQAARGSHAFMHRD